MIFKYTMKETFENICYVLPGPDTGVCTASCTVQWLYCTTTPISLVSSLHPAVDLCITQ